MEQLKEQWKTDAAGGGGGGGDGGDGGKKGGGKKRKKGGAAAADESFYVGDDAPIERLPKKNTKVAVCWVEGRGWFWRLKCGGE